MKTNPDVSANEGAITLNGSTTKLSHSKEDLQMMKDILHEKKREKEKDRDEARDAIKANLLSTRDVVPSSEAEIVNVSQIQLDNANEVLGFVERAIERMRNNVYGVCHACDNPHLIPIEQLKLAPFRTKCIEAKQREDRRTPKYKRG